jgi:hypothetical protein
LFRIAQVPDAPSVDTIEQGEYKHDRRDGVLTWSIPEVSEESSSAAMEFTVKRASSVDEFFPTSVSFRSTNSFAGTIIESVKQPGGGSVPYSAEIILTEDHEGGYKYV